MRSRKESYSVTARQDRFDIRRCLAGDDQGNLSYQSTGAMADEEDGPSTFLSKKSVQGSLFTHNTTYSAKSLLVKLVQQIMSQGIQVNASARLSMIIE